MRDNPEFQFQRVANGDPHKARRKTILAEYPQVRALFGYDRKTILVTGAVVILQFSIAWGISRWALTLPAAAMLACLAGAILSHWCGMAIHEASHNLAARTRLGNRATAWLANTPMTLPMAETFRRYHVEHHARLGVDGEDSDLPLDLEVRSIGSSRVRKLLWLLLYTPAYLMRGMAYARCVSLSEVVNIGAIVLLDILIYRILGPVPFAYLAISTVIGHSFHPVAGHFLHEHYVLSPGQETYSYYGILNHVTFNVGYHYEHHDFMNIPGSRLPEYRRRVAHHYDQLVSHRSWTWVLWHFVTSPAMGPHSRIVRSPQHAGSDPDSTLAGTAPRAGIEQAFP